MRRANSRTQEEKEAHNARMFEEQRVALGLSEPVREHFLLGDIMDTTGDDFPGWRSPKRMRRRKWACDYLFVPERIIVEIEGISGRPQFNRHQSYLGYSNDMRKYNAVAILGYTLLRYSPAQLEEKLFEADVLAMREIAKRNAGLGISAKCGANP